MYNLLRLLANKEHHGSEKLRLAAGNEGVTGNLEGLSDVVGSLGNETNLLETPHGVLGEELADSGRAQDRENVPEGLGLEDVALKGVVPGGAVIAGSEVLLVLDLKANSLQSLASGVDSAHLGDTVTDLLGLAQVPISCTYLDTVSNLLVLRVRGVPDVGHAPLVDGELRVSGEPTPKNSQCLRA